MLSIYYKNGIVNVRNNEMTATDKYGQTVLSDKFPSMDAATRAAYGISDGHAQFLSVNGREAVALFGPGANCVEINYVCGSGKVMGKEFTFTAEEGPAAKIMNIVNKTENLEFSA